MRNNPGKTVIAELPEYLVVFNTCPDSETAGRIAADLVEDKLAACVQVLPGLQSYFHWAGKVDCADEHLLLIKTSSASYPALERRIRELHPYELPEIIGVPVNRGLPEYLSWIDDKSSGQTICTAPAARRVAPKDGRNDNTHEDA